MRVLNNIVNEFDIALKTLSNKKSGTGRTYPPEPAEKNTEKFATANRMTKSQIKSAVQRKRSKKQGVGGKPTNVKTFTSKKRKK